VRAKFDEEDTQRHKLDRKIKPKGVGPCEGISARRRRNQGRVRALGIAPATLDMIRRQGVAARRWRMVHSPDKP